MTHATPPALPHDRAQAERAIGRCAGLAGVSAWIMLVLGGLSLLVSLAHPLSAGFAISAAVVVNGWLERRFARELARADLRAPSRLAVNQLALGLEIAAYGAWQAWTFSSDDIDRVLQRPVVARFLAVLDPAAVSQLVGELPEAVRTLYWTVGGLACLGCVVTAWYYHSRTRSVRLLAANPPGGPVSIQPPPLP